MSRQGRLLKIVCVLLPLAILAPLGLALGASMEHYCACGMKKGECFCDLSMHRQDGHCGKGGTVGMRCALRAPHPMSEEGPRVPLDLRNQVGVFAIHAVGTGPEPGGALELSESLSPLSLFAPPESPPPRTSLPLS